MKHFAPRRLHISLMLWINRDTAYPGGNFFVNQYNAWSCGFPFFVKRQSTLARKKWKFKSENKIRGEDSKIYCYGG